MDKRLRTNLALAAAVVALGLVIWLVPRQDEEAIGFAMLDSETALSEIHVFHDGALHFSLARQGDGWRLTAPAELPADAFQVDALLDTLRAKAQRRYSLQEVAVDELGLAEPEWTLKANGEELAIGARTALGNNRYVMEGEHVYLVSEVLHYRLARSPWDYAAKQLLPEGSEIAGLTLPAGIRIEKEGPGWKVIPENPDMTSDELQQRINAWSNATAIRVTPAASVPRDGEAVIEFDDGRVLRFGIEIRDDELLLSRDTPPVTYVLPAHATGELLHVAAGERE